MAEIKFPNNGSIRDFLAALASPDDAHGTVGAAAIAGAMGASLLQMVAALPQTLSHGSGAAELMSAAAVLVRIQEELLETVETDTAVKLFAARNMPQASTAERVKRESAIQFALRAAAEVPLEVIRLCGSALQRAETVAGHSPRAASTEMELAVALLEAALNAARSNLEAKLPILSDGVHVASIAEEVAGLSHDAAVAAEGARSSMKPPPT